jgi:hypothetical protein
MRAIKAEHRGTRGHGPLLQGLCTGGRTRAVKTQIKVQN